MEKQYISRYYVQPQWIFDSVNARELLPVNKYFMGEILPPHLSPFTNEGRHQEYMPPEEKALYDPEALEELHKKGESDEDADEEEEETENADTTNEQVEEEEEEEDEDEEVEAEETAPVKKKLKVTPGEIYKEVPWEKSRQERQEYKLREKLVKNKHRKLYKSMMAGRKERAKEIWLLRKKRRLHDEKQKEEKKAKKKQQKSASVS
ncbi:Pescadillo homolog-like Protein [Tribolium castaneum]|uniref:Pescadillo homolog-like Protein n=1 Tax=Tribolium castaneum TaxID=7070 RepID=D7ELJ8_TRICA|nr:PREDICTED: pescadillo homolog [Tribolium castaneum]EFA12199.1 Pescadillo homolog-like Protein [Tribolium castaneum]|eukprot:XP_001808441.2 PREDICTED: pescadillo homolog [Tribolium castaneum]